MTALEAMQVAVQDCLKKLPVIVLGSGASAAHGIPGMWPLGEHLAASALPVNCASKEDSDGWRAFLEKVKHTDL